MGFYIHFKVFYLNPFNFLSGIAKKYSALHLGDYSDDELSKAKSESERIQGKLLYFHKISVILISSLDNLVVFSLNFCYSNILY